MGEERWKKEAVEVIDSFQLLPRLVVFDLDYTLWPFYCECRSKREMPSLYPHAKGILYALKDKGIDIAIASRSPTPDIANAFLDKLGLQSLFMAQKERMSMEMALEGERVKEDAVELLRSFQPLPRLVVFDLDYTLWPFYCDSWYKGEMPLLYPHAKGIIHAIKDSGIDVAIASRSHTPDIAMSFLDILELPPPVFAAQEIFASYTHKTDHFQKIQRRTMVPYNSMLFFDDEDRNIQAVSKLGVTSILVGDGVNLAALRQGLTKFSQNAGSSSTEQH